MTSALIRALIDEVVRDDEALDALAERLASRLERRRALTEPREDGWLNTTDAARYLACTRARVHDLVQLGKLQPRRDGRRLLFRRADLDAYVGES